MPQIPTYTAPEQDTQLRIPEGGAQTLSQGARRLGVMGNEAATAIERGTRELAGGVGEVGKALEQHQALADISQMHQDVADFTAHSLKQIGDIEANVDPNNIPAALGQVNQMLADARDQYAQKYQTKAGQARFETLWNERSDLIRNHIIGTAANASGDAAKKNLEGSLQTYIGTVATNGDMTTFDSLLQAGNKSIEDHSQMVPGEKRQQFVTDLKSKYADQLATSTLEGMITRDPGQAKAILDSGRLDQYLVGQEKNTLYKHIETAGHVKTYQARADAAETRRIERDAFDQRATDLETSMVNPDGSLKVPANFGQSIIDMGKLPGEKSSKIENLMKLGHSITEQQAKGVPDQTDQTVRGSLASQILSNPEQPNLENQLFQAKVDHKLSDKDFTLLRGQLRDGQKQGLTSQLDTQVINQGLAAVQSKMNVVPGSPGPGNVAYARFMTWFQSSIASRGNKTVGQVVTDLMDKIETDPKFLDRFKTAGGANSGSGLAVTAPIPEGGAAAPLPPTQGLLNKWFGIGQ